MMNLMPSDFSRNIAFKILVIRHITILSINFFKNMLLSKLFNSIILLSVLLDLVYLVQHDIV